MMQTTSSEQAPVRRRLFKGNPNYIQLYNAHCNSHSVVPEFKQTYIPHIKRPSSLGTTWSKNEKSRFFELLGRYSIHHVDSIAKALQRSEEDVLNYYHRLKKLLSHLKKDKNHFHTLLRIDQMPIAFEMSQSFVDMENEQLRCLAAFERMHARKQDYRAKIKATEEDLIDIVLTGELLKLYNAPLLTSARDQTRLVSELYLFLNQFIITMTKKIILDILVKKLTKVPKKYPYDAKEFRKFNEGLLSFKIAKLDIRRSAKKLYPKGPHLLADYWSEYKGRSKRRSGMKSLRLSAMKGDSVDEGEHSDSSVSGVSDSSLDESDNDVSTPIKTENDLKSTPIREVTRVPRGNWSASKSKFGPRCGKFIDDETEPIIDSEIAEEVFMRESRYLNDKDLVDSRHHEHILLTFLSTANLVQLKNNNKTLEMYRAQKPPIVEDCYEESDEEGEERISEDIDPALAFMGVDREEEDGEAVNSEMIIMHLYDYATY